MSTELQATYVNNAAIARVQSEQEEQSWKKLQKLLDELLTKCRDKAKNNLIDLRQDPEAFALLERLKAFDEEHRRIMEKMTVPFYIPDAKAFIAFLVELKGKVEALLGVQNIEPVSPQGLSPVDLYTAVASRTVNVSPPSSPSVAQQTVDFFNDVSENRNRDRTDLMNKTQDRNRKYSLLQNFNAFINKHKTKEGKLDLSKDLDRAAQLNALIHELQKEFAKDAVFLSVIETENGSYENANAITEASSSKAKEQMNQVSHFLMLLGQATDEIKMFGDITKETLRAIEDLIRSILEKSRAS